MGLMGIKDRSDSVERAWVRVRANLKESAGHRLFEQWLKPMELVPHDEGDPVVVRLALPSPFMTNWVTNHYAERLVLEFRNQLAWVQAVQIETRRRETSVATISAVPTVANDAAPAPVPAPVAAGAASGLDERFTFERFVVDPANQVAHNAARLLAQPGAPRFSPLFLHSTSGQGKTHLMHAIGHAFLAQQPEAKVIMLSAERFMFEFVQALRARDTYSFKARMRSADLLMVDDVHFMAGKDSTQEEFFHTINEVMGTGRRLVISADRAPHGLDGVESRIVSRLAVGLVAGIKDPDLDLRRAVLERRRAELIPGTVPDEVIELLSTRITSSIRAVEGALARVVAYAQLTGEAVTAEFAVQMLGDALGQAGRRITIDEIQKAVSAHFELKPLDLISARRAVVVARPRQIAMYLAKRLTTRSLPEIGRKFGGRDHSTVIHAVKRIEELREKDLEIDGAVKALLRQLES